MPSEKFVIDDSRLFLAGIGETYIPIVLKTHRDMSFYRIYCKRNDTENSVRKQKGEINE